MRLTSVQIVVIACVINLSSAIAQTLPVSSKARYDYYATKFSEMRPGWLANGCHTAPLGRSEYLKPAWDCLCLQR